MLKQRMHSEQSDPASNSGVSQLDDFDSTRSLVRLTAWLLLLPSGLGIANWSISMIAEEDRSSQNQRWESDVEYYLELYDTLAPMTLNGMLWICAIGALMGQSWARRGIVIWAALALLFFAVDRSRLLIGSWAGTYRFAGESGAMLVWRYIISLFAGSCWPLTVAVIFTRKSVVNYFSNPPHRAFPVRVEQVKSEE